MKTYLFCPPEMHEELGLSPRGGALLPPHGIQGEMQLEKKAKVLKRN